MTCRRQCGRAPEDFCEPGQSSTSRVSGGHQRQFCIALPWTPTAARTSLEKNCRQALSPGRERFMVWRRGYGGGGDGEGEPAAHGVFGEWQGRPWGSSRLCQCDVTCTCLELLSPGGGGVRGELQGVSNSSLGAGLLQLLSNLHYGKVS